jgi:hypothetical protein
VHPDRPANPAGRTSRGPLRAATLLVATLLATVALPPLASAQTARQSLRDLDRFREALSPCVANVSVLYEGSQHSLRIRRTDGGFDVLVPDAYAVDVSDTDAGMALRLLAALLATGDLEGVLQPLGYEIDDEILGLIYIEPGDVLVQRVGDGAAHIAFEPGIARTREIVLGREEAKWTVRATEYGSITGGWWPTEASVWRGDQRVLEFRVFDAAPSATALSPLVPPVPPRPRFPRLPL